MMSLPSTLRTISRLPSLHTQVFAEKRPLLLDQAELPVAIELLPAGFGQRLAEALRRRGENEQEGDGEAHEAQPSRPGPLTDGVSPWISSISTR